MFRTIVVGCDGSERSADALVLARQLRHPDGRLHLVAVHPHFGPLPDRTGGFHYGTFVAEDAERALDDAVSKLGPDIPVSRHVFADDSPAGAIDRLALEIGADLIVLGSTHHHRLGRLTGRTTVQRLLQGAPCAVAVAAPGQSERFGERPRICVAYDGSSESERALGAAYSIAEGTGASVVLLRVIEPIMYAAGYAPVPADLDAEEAISGSANSEIADAAARAPEGVAVERLVLYGPAVKSILETARTGFDLLVTGSRHYGPLHRVLAGSVSAPLLTDGRIPVLVTARTVAAASRETTGARELAV